MPRGILATCTRQGEARRHGRRPCGPRTRRRYADEPFVHLLPEGQWPATASVYGSNAVQVQVAVRRGRRPHHRDQRHRQPHQGHRGRRGAEHEHRPRPRRGRRPLHDRSRSVSVTRSHRDSRRRASPPGSRRTATRTWPSWSTTGPAAPPRASSPPTASRPRPSSGPSRCCKGGEVTAVVLNSGGANACTGPQGFQDTHATAEKVAEVLGQQRRRGRGLPPPA